MHAFIVDASSSFYSEFGCAITEEVDRWLDEKHADDPPEEPEEEPLDLMNLPFDPAQAAARPYLKKQTGE